MYLRRMFLNAAALSFLVAIVTGPASWGAPPTGAGQWNSALVTVSGTVTGQPESVDFSGNVQIGSKLALDDTGNGHDAMIYHIDLSGLSGVGSSTKKKYVVSGPDVVQRLRVGSDVIDVTFPFFESDTTGTASRRAGRASFSLTIDTANGAVLAAMGSIGNLQ